MAADLERIETLKAIVGDGVEETILKALLLRAGGDVAAAANSFFDGGAASLTMGGGGGGDDFGGPGSAGGGGAGASHCAVGEDVLGTLFKTLEDQGRKLAGARLPLPCLRAHTLSPSSLCAGWGRGAEMARWVWGGVCVCWARNARPALAFARGRLHARLGPLLHVHMRDDAW